MTLYSKCTCNKQPSAPCTGGSGCRWREEEAIEDRETAEADNIQLFSRGVELKQLQHSSNFRHCNRCFLVPGSYAPFFDSCGEYVQALNVQIDEVDLPNDTLFISQQLKNERAAPPQNAIALIKLKSIKYHKNANT